MATLGSLTKTVPISPARGGASNTIILNSSNAPSMAATDLTQESILEIRRYVKELIGQSVLDYPPVSLSTADKIIQPNNSNPFYYDEGDNNGFIPNDPSYTIARKFLEDANLNIVGYGLPADGIVDEPITRPELPARAYASTILSNNRFSGLNSIDRFQDPQTGEQSTLGTIITSQQTSPSGLGSYSPASINGPGISLSMAPKYDGQNIPARNVAMRLLVNASGRRNVGESLLKDMSESNLRKKGLAALIPSQQQMGLASVGGLSILASSGEISFNRGKNQDTSIPLGYAGNNKDSGSSYGTITTPLHPFEDPSGQLLIAAAGAVSLIAVASLFALALPSKRRSQEAWTRTSAMQMGKRDLTGIEEKPKNGVANGVLNAIESLGLLPDLNLGTDFTHSPGDCMLAGILQFFGFEMGGGQGFIDGAKNLSVIYESPGYFVPVIRNILKDRDTINEYFKNFTKNPIGGTLNFKNVIESSSIYKFVIAMMKIGEVSLTSIESRSDIYTIPANSGLSSESYPMHTVLPTSFLSSALLSQMLGEPGALQAYARAPIAKTINDSIKIPIEQVRLIEQRISSQYFPFTIHDLRTNEIVELGAFLTELSDGFAAKYNSTSAYGRTEPVHTYADTTRSIKFGFYLVATNPRDFDYMWMKINKLTTLLYPQYSKGRLVQKNGNSFRMPFSQVITASPMVRIRIGEAVTSNFSKFNLTRLFGTGEAMKGASYAENFDNAIGSANATYATGGGTPGVGNASATLVGGSRQLIESALSTFSMSTAGLNNTGDTTTIGLNNTLIDQNASDFYLNVMSKVALEVDKRRNPSIRNGDGLGYNIGDVAVLRRDIIATRLNQPNVVNRNGQPQTGFIERGRQRRLINKIRVSANTRVIIESVEENNRYIVTTDLSKGDRFFVDHVSLSPDIEAFFQQAVSETASPDNETGDSKFDVDNTDLFVSALQRFFNADPQLGPTNPIVRSFQNSMSEGMAGFVTNMDFDYGIDTHAFELAPGARAPMVIKVSMGFIPIHDIAPGLDAHGINRAPVYRVGHLNNQLAGLGGIGGTDPFGAVRGDGEATYSSAEDAARSELRNQIRDDLQEQADAQAMVLAEQQARANYLPASARRAPAAASSMPTFSSADLFSRGFSGLATSPANIPIQPGEIAAGVSGGRPGYVDPYLVVTPQQAATILTSSPPSFADSITTDTDPSVFTRR